MDARLDPRRSDGAVFALALALRLGFLAVFVSKGLGDVYGRDLYFNLAQSWLGWLPMPAFDATHPPLYTMMIAAVLGLFRSANPLPVLLLQCLAGAGSVLLVRRLGSALADDKTARLAALWCAVDPALIFFTPHLQTETIFIWMTLLFFVGLVREWDRPLSWRLVGLGLWGGLCVLCRSVLGGYPALLFLVLWRAQGLKRAFLFCALLGVGWLAPSLAWTARNYFVYGKVVPAATLMGWNLYEGFTLDREVVRRHPAEMGAEVQALGLTDPIAVGDHFAKKTFALVRADPLGAVKIVIGKAFLFWRPFPYDPHVWWQRGALGVYFTVVFALALWGARGTFNPGSAWGAVWALIVYLTMVHSVFFTSLRYRLPLEPFLALLASAGAVALIKARENRRA